MSEVTTDAAAERARVLEVQKLGRLAKLDRGAINEAIQQGTSVEKFREIALEKVYPDGNVGGEINTHTSLDVTQGRGNGREGLVGRMSEALTARYTGTLVSG